MSEENRGFADGDSMGLEQNSFPIPPPLPPFVGQANLPATWGHFWYDPVPGSQEEQLLNWYSELAIIIPGPEMFIENTIEFMLGGNFVESGDVELEGLFLRFEVTLDDPPTCTVSLQHKTGPLGGPYAIVNESIFPGYEMIADVDVWLDLRAFIIPGLGIGIEFDGVYSPLIELWDISNRQKPREGTNLCGCYQQNPAVEAYPAIDRFYLDQQYPI